MKHLLEFFSHFSQQFVFSIFGQMLVIKRRRSLKYQANVNVKVKVWTLVIAPLSLHKSDS